ncbi:MAG: hypothetical protein AAF518_18520 [Spirochaetota bacterium]
MNTLQNTKTTTSTNKPANNNTSSRLGYILGFLGKMTFSSKMSQKGCLLQTQTVKR